MIVQVLGTGCPKCQLLKTNAAEALNGLHAQTEEELRLEEVTDPETMMEMGMLVSPGLAVDGELLQAGKVLTAEQIQRLVSERMGEKT